MIFLAVIYKFPAVGTSYGFSLTLIEFNEMQTLIGFYSILCKSSEPGFGLDAPLLNNTHIQNRTKVYVPKVTSNK